MRIIQLLETKVQIPASVEMSVFKYSQDLILLYS